MHSFKESRLNSVFLDRIGTGCGETVNEGGCGFRFAFLAWKDVCSFLHVLGEGEG